MDYIQFGYPRNHQYCFSGIPIHIFHASNNQLIYKWFQWHLLKIKETINILILLFVEIKDTVKSSVEPVILNQCNGISTVILWFQSFYWIELNGNIYNSIVNQRKHWFIIEFQRNYLYQQDSKGGTVTLSMKLNGFIEALTSIFFHCYGLKKWGNQ